MTKTIEKFIRDHLNRFTVEVLEQHLCYNQSIDYYLLKYSESSDLTNEEILRKAIHSGIVDDQYTYDDIQNLVMKQKVICVNILISEIFLSKECW